MSQNTTLYKTKFFNKWIGLSIKALVLVGLGYILYSKMYVSGGFSQLSERFYSVDFSKNGKFLVLASVLVFVNIYLETKRWKILISHFIDLSFRSVLKSILIGISMGLITPSRVGEYGGRLINIPSSQRLYAVTSQFLGSLAQNWTNIFFGALGFYYLLTMAYPLQSFINLSVVTFGLFASLFIVVTYFKIELLYKLVSYSKKIATWLDKKMIVDHGLPKKPQLTKVLGISTLRYFIYTSQFVLLLYFFGVEANILPVLAGVSAIFFIQSGLILPPLLNFIARIEIAVGVFMFINIESMLVAASALSLWVLNLLIPAVLGAILLVNTNLTKSITR